MFFIPGEIIALLTFPGVIVHELAHFLFCRWTRTAIFDVCFFRMGNPAGYVIHEPVSDFRKTWLICMGPFFVNTGLCVLFCSAAFLPVWELDIADPLAWFFYWLGLSIGMNAFPSSTDLQHIWEAAPGLAKRGNLLAVVSLPIVGLLFLLNLLRVVWADLGYGIAVGVLGPLALFRWLA